MVLMKDHATKTLEISTKPPFLEDLDEYLRDELHRLRLTEMKPSELRLKVLLTVVVHAYFHDCVQLRFKHAF